MTENCPGHITGHQASGTSCIFGHFVMEKKKEVYSGAWISVSSLADHCNKCVLGGFALFHWKFQENENYGSGSEDGDCKMEIYSDSVPRTGKY